MFIVSKCHELTDKKNRINYVQGLERGARVQLDVLEQRMKAQEAGMTRAKASWAKELAHLKSIIKEKDAEIERLQRVNK